MKDKKKHLTLEGLQKIVNIRASMNKGHTPVLKAAFPNTIPAPRVLIEDKKIKDPNWLTGFSAGEGCFFIDISKSLGYKLEARVKLRFTITQHSRDIGLMNRLVQFLINFRYMV